MDTVQEQLAKLIEQYGQDDVLKSLNKIRTDSALPPTCPKGQTWDGSECVDAVG